MIKKDKLAQFYFLQYKDYAFKHRIKYNGTRKMYEGRCKALVNDLQQVNTAKVKSARLEDLHRQINNVAHYAFRQDNKFMIMKLRDVIIPMLVKIEVESLQENDKVLLTEKMIDFMRSKEPYEICTHTLRDMCNRYADDGVRGQIIDLVPMRPETEFPEVLEMERKFVACRTD